MTAQLEVRDHAALFGWDRHFDLGGDTLIRGSNMVTVDYRKDGSIRDAKRYVFYRVDEPKLMEELSGSHKRSGVLSWLACLDS